MATPRPQASGPDGGATTNGTPMFVQACLNGAVPRDAHLAVPLTPDEIARDARAAVAAGVGALHIHAGGRRSATRSIPRCAPRRSWRCAPPAPACRSG